MHFAAPFCCLKAKWADFIKGDSSHSFRMTLSLRQREPSSLFVRFALQNPDIGKIAVLLGIIEPVSHQKLVACVNAGIIRLFAYFAPTGFIQEGDRRKGRGASLRKISPQKGEGVPRIDNIFHEQDIPPFDLSRRLLGNPRRARTHGRSSVRRNGHKIQFDGGRHGADQVAEKENASLQHAHGERGFALEFPIEPCSRFRDLVLNLCLR